MTDTTPFSDPASGETPPSAGGGLRRILRWFLCILLLLVLGGGGYAAYDAMRFLRTPPDAANPKDVVVDIPAGVTFDRAAWMLYKAGVITDVWRFRLLAQYHKKLGAVQAGEFSFNTGWTPEQVLRHMVSGRPLLFALTLREGLPWWEVAKLVEEGGFAKADEFEAVIHDPEFLRRYGIPFSNAEGFLFPETYHLRKPRRLGGREQAETMARILVETFWRRSWPLLVRYAAADTATGGTPLMIPGLSLKNDAPLRPSGPAQPEPARTRPVNGTARNATASGNATAPPAAQTAARPPAAPVSAETLRRLVILASLVEKETGVPDERARVAGVYANRLRLGMLLQCDPTIIYGLGKNQSGPIRKSQLADVKNPYNTYQHPGLPPGPICSPGLASMKAAVEPEQHSYLYFVATGQGGKHTFSTNINDHNRAVMQYRATQR